MFGVLLLSPKVVVMDWRNQFLGETQNCGYIVQTWYMEGRGIRMQSILNQYAQDPDWIKEEGKRKGRAWEAGPLSEAKEQMAWDPASLFLDFVPVGCWH